MICFVEIGGSDSDPGTKAQPFATQAHAETVALADGDLIVLLNAPSSDWQPPDPTLDFPALKRQGGSFVAARYKESGLPT